MLQLGLYPLLLPVLLRVPTAQTVLVGQLVLVILLLLQVLLKDLVVLLLLLNRLLHEGLVDHLVLLRVLDYLVDHLGPVVPVGQLRPMVLPKDLVVQKVLLDQ